MMWTGRVIGVPLQWNWSMAKTSSVGVIASMRWLQKRDPIRMRAILPSGSAKPSKVVGLDDDVGEQAVQPIAQLGAEAAHDAVDDDERGHAEHDADDADQRQVARQQIAPAEQQFVHVITSND